MGQFHADGSLDGNLLGETTSLVFPPTLGTGVAYWLFKIYLVILYSSAER